MENWRRVRKHWIALGSFVWRLAFQNDGEGTSLKIAFLRTVIKVTHCWPHAWWRMMYNCIRWTSFSEQFMQLVSWWHGYRVLNSFSECYLVTHGCSIIYILLLRCMGSLHQLEFISLILMMPNGMPLTSVCIVVRDHDGLLMDVVARQETGNHIDLYFGNWITHIKNLHLV